MPIFVVFIFASLVLGAGAMLAPALPTHGPRIGLAGALTLAFITSGSMFIAHLFGWNTLVIDYMWFAAIVGIFFAGTLSAGMFRSEAAGGTKEYGGWPGPREIGFFTVILLIVIAPVLVMPVPLDTDAQGFGYLALTMRESGSLTTLAPFHPEIEWLYSPAFPALIAYLSERLNAGIHTLQFAVGAVLTFLFILVAYDLGKELDPDVEAGSGKWAVTMALTALGGVGLMLAFLDSHFTAVMTLVFGLAFLTFAIRYHREGRRADFWAAAICLSAVPLSQPDMTIALILGYVPWLVVLWFARPRPQIGAFARRWVGLAVGIPLLAVVGVSPWLVRIAPLLASAIRSPFEISTSHLVVLTVYHGVGVVILSLIGILIGLRRRNTVDLMMIVWLALVLDFSSIGLLKAIAPGLLAPILKYDYPFSLAWHGPIIPYMYLATSAIMGFLSKRERLIADLRWWSGSLMALVAVAVMALIAFVQPVLEFSKTTPFMMYGAFSSAADVRAMTWLKDNTPKDSLILNHPGPHEGDWVPLIAARDSVFFRPQPFFRHTEQAEAEQAAFRAFWRTPADPRHEALLRQYGVDYVIQPQVFANPAAITGMWRWRPPIPEAASYAVIPPDLPYLELVFEDSGARVYRVKP